MRFSPTKILQGLLCTTPILLLTLAACGGGGGGGDTPVAASYYSVGGSVSGVSGSGLVLRLNGGNDKAISSVDATYTIGSVAAGSSYNVTVLTNPGSPSQLCSVANASGIMPAFKITNANVSCSTAYTVGGNITGDPLGTGLVLQNNGRDNLLVPAAASSFTFDTPQLGSDSYNVTVLTQPHTPAQTCIPSSNTGPVASSVIATVTINCTDDATPPLPDQFVYTANFGSAGTSGVSHYQSASGVLSTYTVANSGSAPSSIAVYADHAYVTNYSSNTISAYSINALTGDLTPLPDVDAGTSGNQTSIATGSHPYAIAIHPSGKFVYVTNYSSNSVSAYSIGSDGALTKIDADGATAGNQPSIAAKTGPISIAIDPNGGHAYVANSGDSTISDYSIDPTSGALTGNPVTGAPGGATYIATGGTTPYSVAVDPTDTYLYVANRASNDVTYFQTGGGGTLTYQGATPMSNVNLDPTPGASPVSIAIDPTGAYAYVVNTDSDTVNVYEISVGSLSYNSQIATGSQPSSISVDSTGQNAYVANFGASTISSYRLDPSTGVLTPKDMQAVGTQPNAVTTAR